jgi:hypothetical protein
MSTLKGITKGRKSKSLVVTLNRFWAQAGQAACPSESSWAVPRTWVGVTEWAQDEADPHLDEEYPLPPGESP